MDSCIFCKIARGEIDSAKIWQDDEFFAILDLNPNTKGMSLVLPKEHFDSFVFNMPDDIYKRFMAASKNVAKLLEKALGTKRVAMVMEGMGVNHAHIKLYPMYGADDFKQIMAPDRVFFKKYPGYITTIMGKQADLKDLKKLAEEIRPVKI
jgi:diadenosine tetraphosphate (Ap4A) HIT family hydrolase